MRGEIVRNANGAVGIVTGLCPNGRDVRVRTSNGSSPVWSRFSIVHHDGADYATATDMILNGLVVEGADMKELRFSGRQPRGRWCNGSLPEVGPEVQ